MRGLVDLLNTINGKECPAHVLCGCTAALVSRQYMDMSRIRIEGLLAAFPKLVGSGKQHTYVETENVRYVYQPIEVRQARVRWSQAQVHGLQHAAPIVAAVLRQTPQFAAAATAAAHHAAPAIMPCTLLAVSCRACSCYW